MSQDSNLGTPVVEANCLHTLESLASLNLQKFNTKKHLQIELIAPLTPEDEKLLNETVKLGKYYEHISDVHFITQDDVLGLIKRLAEDDENIDLPNHIKQCAREVLKYLPEMQPLNFLAAIAKLKIIESMYKTYRNEVSGMMRRRELHDELERLVKDDESEVKAKGKKEKKGKEGKSKKESKPSKGKKSQEGDTKSGKSSKKSKTALNAKSTTDVIIEDYTDITLDENELIFDHNVDNHLTYIVLSGFHNPLLLQELTKMKAQVSAVIEFTSESTNSITISKFVHLLLDLINKPLTSPYLENTILMKYTAKSTNQLKDTLEELVYLIKYINYIKRQHLHYIKSLKLYDFGPEPKKISIGCMDKYNKIMDGFPPELVNIAVIIEAIIQEIYWRELGFIYTLSDLSSESNDSNENVLPTDVKSYQVHEEDFLNMGLNSFKTIGRQYYDLSLEYLKMLEPLNWTPSTVEMNKKRLRGRIISTEDSCFCSNIKYLRDYLHLAMFSQMKRKDFEIEPPQQYEFASNLVTYNQEEEYRKVVTKVETSGDDNVVHNYHMKEDLSTSVLRQLVYKAMQEYSRCDRVYCHETEATLLRFHDNLNAFNLDTVIWDQHLPSPVCLRDFGKFVATEMRTWLEENKLTQHEDLNGDDSGEECEGLKDLHVPELYQEYQHLLGTISESTDETKKKIFEQVFEEIVTYSKSEDLKQHCGHEDASFMVYDLGPKRVQLTGHTYIFHSDDGVKVTVDTSRFLVDEQKCSVIIDSDKNSLIYHTNNNTNFHVILNDQTLINFFELGDANEDEIAAESSQQSEDLRTNSLDLDNEELAEEDSPNYNDYWVQMLRKNKLKSILPASVSEQAVKMDSRNFEKLLELFKAATHLHKPIYKISTKTSIRRLKRSSSPLHLPLVRTLKRVFFKPTRFKRTTKGYSVLNIARTKRRQPLKYDFQITLPDGLVISTLARNKILTEIKQENQYRKSSELYRIFYATGVILVKRTDGTTTIFRSNGDTINLTDKSECEDDCCKKMKQVFKSTDDDACPYRTSRCDDSTTIKHTVQFVDLYEFGEIPYSRKTLLEFEGKKISIINDVASEKQLYYVISEHDYHAEEVFYEREDGMRCILDRKGKRTFQFPDGSKIESWPQIEKELIHVSSKNEGWVSVVINYKFEHPDYVTVVYDAIGSSTQLFLRDSSIKTTQHSFTMSVEPNLALEVTSECVVFLKTCSSCNGDCVCKIHLDASVDNLVEVCDSYDKYLYWNRSGQLKVNEKFVKTAINKFGCDHRWRSEKQKMFILNKRHPPGSLLWKDSEIEERLDKTNKKNVIVSNYHNKLIDKQTIEIFTEIHQNFTGRFTLSDSKRGKIALSKFKPTNEERRVFYVTYRILTEFQNAVEHPEIVKELGEFLETMVSTLPSSLLSGIQKILKDVERQKHVEEKRSYRITMQEGASLKTEQRESVSKSFDFDKPAVQDIIHKWKKTCEEYKHLIRNRIFPPYFQSEYYRNLLGNSTDNSIESPQLEFH